jgi:ammonia channel protein AmtB
MILEWGSDFDGAQMLWLVAAGLFLIAALLPACAGLVTGGQCFRKSQLTIEQWLTGAALHVAAWILVLHSLAFGPSVGTTPADVPAAAPQPLEQMIKAAAEVVDRRAFFGRGGFVGDLQFAAFRNLEAQGNADEPLFASRRPHHSVPLSAWVYFQLAVYLCAVGSVSAIVATAGFAARRTLIFSLLWGLLVYVPIAHWVWGEGWLGIRYATDAGGSLFLLMLALSAVVLPQHRIEAEMQGAAKEILALCTGLFWMTFPVLMCSLRIPEPHLRSLVMLNSLAAASGGFLVCCLVKLLSDGKSVTESSLAGICSGLSAVAAGCLLLDPMTSMMCGALGTAVALMLWAFCRNRLSADVYRLPIMLIGSSITGLLLVGVFAGSFNGIVHWDKAPVESLLHGATRLLQVQGLTVVSVTAWAIVLTAVLRRFCLRA